MGRPKNWHLANGDISEDAIHLTIMDYVRVYPEISPFVIHFPNESPRSPGYGQKLKRMGMRAGASDLFIALPRHGYHGAFIELKSKNGKLSSHQKLFLADMHSQGYFIAVAYTIEEGINIIKTYCQII